jgi:hypothetical protein
VTLDVGDYEKIAMMIGRVEAKIDAFRKEVVTTEMQAIVLKGIQDDINDIRARDMKDVKERLSALENAPSTWFLRLGVIASLALTLISLLTHVKLLP